jgi:hypothetical protein
MMAGAKSAQGEPDPGHFERFCNVVAPDLLTDVCHVSTELAARIGEDILARAESYAMLGAQQVIGGFISHAWADRKLADLLRDTLVLGGVPKNRIFYSSSRATGIASGTDVRAHLRSELQQAGLVIELISTTFLTRPMCLLELGGAWALEKPTYPIVVPPLTRSQAVTQIGDLNMGQLGSSGEIDDVFDELHDRRVSDLGLSTTATEWNPVARRFKEGLPAVLAGLAAAAVPPAATSSVPSSTSPSRSGAKIAVDNYDVAPSGYGTEVQGEATNNDTGFGNSGYQSTGARLDVRISPARSARNPRCSPRSAAPTPHPATPSRTCRPQRSAAAPARWRR